MLSLFFFALTVGLATPILDESHYTIRREYVYRYLAQTVSGIPGATKIHSGMKMVANMRLRFEEDSVVIAKFENLELYAMNDAIRTQSPFTEQIDPMKMTRYDSPEVYNTLMTPFVFTYIAGHVSSFKAPENEPYWSVNIKRGFASLLQIDTEKTWVTERYKDDEHAYFSYEMTAAGLCRTEYTVENHEFNPEIPKETLIVTKTKDFHNCHLRPEWYKTIFHGKNCAECEMHRTLNFTEAAQSRYTLKGTRTNFVILSAIGDSSVYFYPYTAGRGHVATIINQTMYFMDAYDVGEGTEVADAIAKLNMKPRELPLFLPQEVIDTQFPFADHSDYFRPRDELRYINKQYLLRVFKSIVESINAPEVMKEAAGMPALAVALMRKANETVLSEIWNDYAYPKPTETEEDVVMRKVVWTCMAATGSHASAKLILQSCINKKIPISYCPTLMNKIALANEPNATFIDKLMTVATEIAEGEDPMFVRSLWLTIGTLTNKLVHYEKYEIEKHDQTILLFERMMPYQHNELARRLLRRYKTYVTDRRDAAVKLYTDMRERVVTLIKSELVKAGSAPKIMALKTAGNTGLPELIPYITEIIEDTGLPEEVRFFGVFAMHKMAELEPKMVYEPLISVFMKTTDLAAVRIAAFLMIMLADPPRTVFEMMGRHIAREPDLQVASFMYSFFQTTSNSTHPCYEKLAKESAHALHLAHRVEPGIYYSSFKAFEFYNYNRYIPAGVGAHLDIIGANSSFIPKSITAHFNAYLFGVSTNVMEFGIYTEGLSKSIDKLIGREGVFTNRKSVLDILSPRVKRNVNVAQKIEEYTEKLRITPRRYPESFGSMYIKLFGYELRYFDLEDFLERLARTGKISFSYKETETGVVMPIDFKELMYLGDAQIFLPTEAGFPVSLSIAVTAAAKAKGRTNFKVTPALFESRRQTAPMSATAYFKFYPSFVVELNGLMSLHAFGASAGTGFRMITRSAVPLVGNFTADLPRRKFAISIEPPIKEEPIVEIESYPMTYQSLSPVNIEKIIEITHGARIVEDTYEYGENALGIKVYGRCRRASRYGNYYWTPSFPFTGRNTIQLFFKPGFATPKILNFRAQLATGIPLKTSKNSEPIESSSCDCLVGRLTLCMVSCEEEDVTDPDYEEGTSYLEDFPNLKTKDVTMAALKGKLQAKLGSSVRLSPFGHKWGMIAIFEAKAAPDVVRKFQFEALWQSINKDHMHQFAFRFVRTPLPSYPRPWEMVTHGMLQYPNRVVHPNMILDPSYHVQIHRDLRFMTRLMNHRPLLTTLNDTAVTILKRHLQHLAGNPKPELLLRTLALQMFARTNITEVRALYPTWRKMIIINEWIEKVWHKSFDPIYLMKHKNSVFEKFAAIEEIHLFLIQKLQELKRIEPMTMFYVPTLQYCVFEHYRVMFALNNICYRASKMNIFPKAMPMHTKTVQMIDNFNDEYVQYANFLKRIPHAPERIPYALRKLWPTFIKISEEQTSAFITLKNTGKAHKLPSVQSIVDVVGTAKETIPVLMTTLKNIKTVPFEFVPILLKLTHQHFMIYESLRYLMDTPTPISRSNESQFVYQMSGLKSQVSALALTSAILIKYHYESITMETMISEADMVVVKKLQKFQFEIGYQMYKIFNMGIYPGGSPHREIPEEGFSNADSILEFSEKFIFKLKPIVEKFEKSNIEPDLFIFEKAILTVFQLRDLVRELKVYIQRNMIYSTEIARSVNVVKRCDEFLITIEFMELNITKSFERIWLSASMIDVKTPMPMAEDLVEVAISATSQRQTEVMKKIEYLSTAKRISIEPYIESLIDVCRSIQGQIDWIQLWGIPLGELRPMFAHVITMQQEIIKKLRVVFTAAENNIENPTHFILAFDDLQGELSRIVKMGTVDMTEVRPIPTNVPYRSIPINPVTKMVSTYFPLAMTGYCNISFGAIGTPLKTIVMKMYAIKSFEQLMWESHQLSPLVRDTALDMAIAREESPSVYDMYENPIYRRLNSLNHRHLTIRYEPEDIPNYVKLAMHKFKYFFVHCHYWNTKFNYPVEKTPGYLQIMNEVKMEEPAGDVYIFTPNETISMHGIRTPVISALAFPVAFTKPVHQRRLSLEPYLGPYYPTACRANFKNIRTFDGVEYYLPNIGTCPVVLAMDCSPDKRFVITVKSEAKDFSRKILEIIAEDTIIHLASTVTGATMLMNGEAVTVTRSKPYIKEKTMSYGEGAVAVKITKDMYYRVELPLLGIYITTDGNFVEVKASPMYRMRTCGLCGNMDSQHRYEFEAPEGHWYDTPEPFVRSYIIKGPNCPVPYTHKVGGAGKLKGGNPMCTLFTNPVKTETERVCFGLFPIEHCNKGCISERSIELRRFLVRCLPKGPRATEIERSIERGLSPDIDKLTKGVKDEYMDVKMEVGCRPY